MGKKSRLSTGRLKSGVLSASVMIAHDPTFWNVVMHHHMCWKILRRGSAAGQHWYRYTVACRQRTVEPNKIVWGIAVPTADSCTAHPVHCTCVQSVFIANVVVSHEPRWHPWQCVAGPAARLLCPFCPLCAL